MRVIRTLDELLTLPQDRHVNGFRGRASLLLDIPEVSRPMLMRAQDSLNSLQERGGSLAGAAIMFLALLAGVSKVLHENESLLSWLAMGELILVLAVSFALGYAARWAALAITRLQFAYRCRVQHDLLAMLLPR
ncbi:MAG: hypothetical protein ABI821_16090 [Pseudomonadota bacterium]